MDIRRDFDIKHIIDRLAKDLKTIGIKNKNSDVFIKRSGWYIVLLNEVIVNLRYNLKYLIAYRSTKLMRRTLKVIFWRLSMFLSKR
jgi:hypothetical protein